MERLCKYKIKYRCSFFLEFFENSTTDIVWAGRFMRIDVFNSLLMPGVDMASGGMFGCVLVPLSGIGSSDSDVKTEQRMSQCTMSKSALM